jgi:hypothetical protein
MCQAAEKASVGETDHQQVAAGMEPFRGQMYLAVHHPLFEYVSSMAILFNVTLMLLEEYPSSQFMSEMVSTAGLYTLWLIPRA